MADLSGMVTLSGVDDFKYDAATGILYLVNDTGSLYRWDVQSGTFLSSVTLGGPVETLALTSDSKYALVGRADQGTIERVDLTTLTDQPLSFSPSLPLGNVWNLAVTASGTAMTVGNLFAAEGQSPGLTLTTLGGDTTFPFGPPNSYLNVSEDGRYILMGGGDSGGELALFDSATNSIVGEVGIYGPGSGGFNDGLADVSSAAGLVVNSTYQHLEVFDLHLRPVKDLSYLTGAIAGVHFSHDGHLLFVWNDAANVIQAYDTHTWQLESLISVPAIPNAPHPLRYPSIGEMDASADGRFLFLNMGAGVYVVDLAAELHPAIRGDATHTVLQGTAGPDVIYAGAGDTILPSGGGDTFFGTGGGTVSYAAADTGLTFNFDAGSGVGTVSYHGVDTLVDMTNVIGTAFDDTFNVDPAISHNIDGGGGNNTISLGGWSFIIGATNTGLQTIGAVSSVIDLTGGLSTITTSVNGVLHTVTDTFTNFHTAIGLGTTLYIGTTGNDTFGSSGTVSYANATSAVTVDTRVSGAQNTGGAGTDTLFEITGLIGSSFDDNLAANWIDGGAGNDVLVGVVDWQTPTATAAYASAASGVTVSLALQGTPQNTIGDGIDTLTGFENLVGSAFSDHLTGDANDNIIDGGSGGDDVLDGAGGTNTASFATAAHGVTVSLALQGSPQATGAGAVTLTNFQNLTGSAFDDTLEGDGGDNVLDGGGGTNTVSYAHAAAGVTVNLNLQNGAQNTGGAGTDTLSHFENVIGSAFNDTIIADNNDNALDGGGGINTVSYVGDGIVTVSLALQGQAQNTGGAGTDTLRNFQNLTGSGHSDDVLAGDNQDNVIDGGGTTGGSGTVTYAAAGPVVLTATGAYSATVTGQGTDTLQKIAKVVGSAFNDTFNAAAGSAFTFDGGGGFDTVSYAAAGSGITITTNAAGVASTAGGASGGYVNIQQVVGSAFNDTLIADPSHGLNFDGGGGTNTFSFANASPSDLYAGIYPGFTRAVIDLSGGQTETYLANGGPEIVRATYSLAHVQNAIGGYWNDLIIGNAADNVLDGGAGNNTVSYASSASGVMVSLALQGRAQDTHGAGVDTLSHFQNLVGSAFNDVLTGDSNANVLTGGGGADTFVFGVGGGADEVTDFSHAQGDRLDLSAFRGSIHSLSDVLARTTQAGANAVIDLGGGASVTLDNVQKAALTASDFILAPTSAANPVAGGLHINIAYDASVSSAPAGFTEAAQAAVDYLESLIFTPITVTIEIGYGEVGGQAMSSADVGESLGFGSQTVSYAAFRAVLAASANTPDSVAAAASLPLTSPLNGGSITIDSAEAKALGLAPANGGGIDGAVGLSANTNYGFSFDPNHNDLGGKYDAIGVFEHEITEALGRVASLGAGGLYSPMDLFRYTSPGVRDLTPGPGSFSLDGQTLLFSFNNPLNGGDAGDWATGGWPDTFNAAASVGQVEGLSPTDLRLMDALGYHPAVGTSATPPATPVPGVAATDPQTPTQSLTLAQGQTVYVANNNPFIPSAAAYTLDSLAGGGSMTNAGTIEVMVPSPAIPAVAVSATGGQITFVNAATGAIYVHQADPYNLATGVVSGLLGASVDNAGLIQVVSERGTASGYAGSDPMAPFVNEATGTVRAWAFESATGVSFVSGGSFSNAGLITAAGRTAIGVHNPTSFSNTGSIIATDADGGWGSTGLDLSGPISGSALEVFNNSGLIQGDYAIYDDTTFLTPAQLNITLNNSGHLVGDVVFGAASTHITNTGIIDGALFIGDGASTLDSHLGTINGAVSLGAGAFATLGAEDNTVVLASGTHTVDGGGGTNTLSYAHAASGVTVSLALQGQAQATGVGTDTFSNFQALIGSAYNDTLEAGGLASATLAGGLGADTFVYRAGDGAVTVADYSAAQGDKVDLRSILAFTSLNEVLAASSQVGSDTVITVGAGSLRLQNVSMASLTASDFLLPTTETGTSANHFTADFEGVYRQYTVGAGASIVTGGPEVADILVNIQRLQFVDGYLAVSPTDTAGQVYRLYEATLGRAPDHDGLVYWTDALNSGATLQSAASGFVNSVEFQSTYGSLNNSDFVTLIYENVLHRGPDAGGLSYWTNLLNTGQDSRAQVVTGFSESQEDITDLAAPIQQGLWIGNAPAAEVARLYDSVFSRLPDASGEAYWTNALETGVSLQTAANGFVASAEFQSTYGSLNNSDFVTLIYNNVLHRGPDAGGLSYWVGQLSAGASRAQVVVGFSESAEHVTNTAPHVDDGVWVTG